MSGTLFIVATPIGNLEDITLRALHVLKAVDLIAAEDTRHSRKLLNHFGIDTPLQSLHEHNEDERSAPLVERLLAGESLALISDAGTPTIADPGYRLVGACRAAGVPVAAVPGPSAITAALSVAGLPTDTFRFIGFLPAKRTARCQSLAALATEKATTVCYETPHRLLKALHDLVEMLGERRPVTVVRELTKVHEEVVQGEAAAVLAEFGARDRVRGEIVLLIGPAADEEPSGDWREALRERLAAIDAPPKQIVKDVAKEFGVASDEVYRAALALRAED